MERNEEIKNFIAELHELLASNTPAFVKISHALFMAKVKNFHKDLAYESFYDFAYDEFGLQKTSVKDYFSVAESFLVEDWTHFGSDGHAYREPELKPDYKDFSFYQLVELVPISSSERPLIKPDMTIRQIREWKRNHKLVSVNNTWKLWGELTDKEKQQYEVQQTKTNDENGSGRTSDQVKNNVANLEIAETPVISIDYQTSDFYVDCSELKNTEERRAFVEDFKKWGIWFTVSELKLTYYRYSFLNGDFFVVSEFQVAPDSYCSKYRTLTKYHLVDSEHSFDPGGNGVTLLVDYLTKNRNIEC